MYLFIQVITEGFKTSFLYKNQNQDNLSFPIVSAEAMTT